MNKNIKIAAASICLLQALVASTAFAAIAMPETFNTQIISRVGSSNLCIDGFGYNTYVNLTPCFISSGTGGDNHQWRFSRFRGHTYYNAAYLGRVSHCLDDYKKSDNVGTWDCHGGTNQNWTPVHIRDNVFNLVAKNNYCLTNISGTVMVEKCNGSSSQNWVLPAFPVLQF